jgi:hypothetical protein
MRRALVILVILVCAVGLVAGCAQQPATPPPGLDDEPPGQVGRCDDAFAEWAAAGRALNDPEASADLVDGAIDMERLQQRVFQRCTLDEAETINRVTFIELPNGARMPLIEGDFRAFADVECVDEGPPLSNSKLCREIAGR